MPLIETKGAASAQGFGEFSSSGPVNYIEDVFSTYLYTGNSSTQTITNGIDLSGKGGLVWLKGRSNGQSNVIADTARGVDKVLFTESTSSQVSTTSVTSFNSNGFSLGNYSVANYSTFTYASWTFRKQAKFFDVVTYTGTGSTQNISHNLGSQPSAIFIKSTSAVNNWTAWFRAGTNAWYNGFLNSSTALAGPNTFDSLFTPTQFSNSGNSANGVTYVAYLFASDAGGFGLSGTDNVISCGSYTGNGSATGPTVTLGWEPQWLLVKCSSSTGDWNLIDNMRGFTVGGTDAELNPNLSDAESTGTFVTPTATGFQVNTTDAGYNTSSATYIYIAIRRGPMKVPTSGTEVFSPNVVVGNGSTTTGQFVSTGFPVDMVIQNLRTSGTTHDVYSRLRGISNTATNPSRKLLTNSTAAEVGDAGPVFRADQMLGYLQFGYSGFSPASWNFRRAPGFFDEVCYTGNGTAGRAISHNLSAIPELIVCKARTLVQDGAVYNSAIGNTYRLRLFSALGDIAKENRDDGAGGNFGFNPSLSTSSTIVTGLGFETNRNTYTYVVYLFATVAGVSKVGSYTGSGTTQVINCGFTAGSRFVMIKRTDSTGDWYVWDSARGIVAGDDPYLLLNSTAAEVTNTDYIDTASTGFEISSTAPAAINASGGSFIFLAIA